MNKNKYLLLVISFIFTMFICSNVFAKDYGYYVCANGDRWTPEQDCRIRDGVDSTGKSSNKQDGELEDGAKPVDGALTINVDANGNVTGVDTDLFNLTIEYNVTNYSPIEWIKDDEAPGVFYATPGIITISSEYIEKCNSIGNVVKNLLKCKDLFLEQIKSISFNKPMYYHDYSPIERYYKTNGKLPTVIVAEKQSHSVEIAGWFGEDVYTYVYYPSDWLSVDKANVETSVFTPGAIFYNMLHSNRSEGFWGFNISSTIIGVLGLTITPQSIITNPINNSVSIYREVYYFSSDLSSNANINSCDDLENELAIYGQMLTDYGEKDNRTLEQEENIRNSCKDYIKKDHKTSYSDCYKICIDIDRKLIEAGSGSYKKTNECGFGEDMVAWIIRILKIVRFIVPVLVIVLSIVDYIAAISSADDDAIKKAGNRFSKRLLIMILIFLLPSLIQFILGIFNVPGFSSSNPYCLK